jgi:SAM-dependent methyltransferase
MEEGGMTITLDESKIESFVGQVVGDMAATVSGLLTYLGDKLGLWKAMADGEPVTPAELATKTGTAERYVREWLSAQAAGGYVTYDPKTESFTLPPEHAMVLADEESPALVIGGFSGVASAFSDHELFENAFRTGQGVGWHEHDHRLFAGTERFFRPGYRANLTTAWLPALEGVVEKLEAGATVADVGCGHGTSTIVMAQAFPNSRFVGLDYHDGSIAAARKAAAEAGVADRVTFEVAPAKDIPGGPYDLICYFDCLHDMGDPVGAVKHARTKLTDDGTVMLIEPNANDRLEDNLNVVGRAFYSFSTVICTPASLAQEVGLGLGAQAGEGRLRAVFEEGGFSRFRRATETPFNIVLEAKP